MPIGMQEGSYIKDMAFCEEDPERRRQLFMVLKLGR
jgi:hypothetical protein